MIASFIQRHYRVVGISKILWDRLPAGKQLDGAPNQFRLPCQNFGRRRSGISSLGRLLYKSWRRAPMLSAVGGFNQLG